MPVIGGSLKTGWGIGIANLDEIKRKLKAENLYSEPMKDAMDDIGELGQDYAIMGSPVYTGLLVNKMYYRVGAGKPFPASVRIGTSAQRGGFYYPRLLNYSPKHGHMHFFDEAIQRAWPRVERVLQTTAHDIEREWGD